MEADENNTVILPHECRTIWFNPSTDTCVVGGDKCSTITCVSMDSTVLFSKTLIFDDVNKNLTHVGGSLKLHQDGGSHNLKQYGGSLKLNQDGGPQKLKQYGGSLKLKQDGFSKTLIQDGGHVINSGVWLRNNLHCIVATKEGGPTEFKLSVINIDTENEDINIETQVPIQRPVRVFNIDDTRFGVLSWSHHQNHQINFLGKKNLDIQSTFYIAGQSGTIRDCIVATKDGGFVLSSFDDGTISIYNSRGNLNQTLTYTKEDLTVGNANCGIGVEKDGDILTISQEGHICRQHKGTWQYLLKYMPVTYADIGEQYILSCSKQIVHISKKKDLLSQLNDIMRAKRKSSARSSEIIRPPTGIINDGDYVYLSRDSNHSTLLSKDCRTLWFCKNPDHFIVGGDRCTEVTVMSRKAKVLYSGSLNLKQGYCINSGTWVRDNLHAIVATVDGSPTQFKLLLVKINEMSKEIKVIEDIKVDRPTRVFPVDSERIGVLSLSPIQPYIITMLSRDNLHVQNVIKTPCQTGSARDDVIVSPEGGFLISSSQNGEIYRFGKNGDLVQTIGVSDCGNQPIRSLLGHDGEFYMATDGGRVYHCQTEHGSWDLVHQVKRLSYMIMNGAYLVTCFKQVVHVNDLVAATSI